MKTKLSLAVFSIMLLFWPKNAAAQCSTYGGRATVFKANVANLLPVVLADTGSINSTGGVNDTSLLNASVLGLLSGGVLSATAGGSGNSTLSQASMAGVTLSVAGNTIGAGLVLAEAKAYCGNGVSAKSEIDGLVVNGQGIAVTGAPNQTVSLLGGGFIILNEQISDPTNGGITVNAMHVSVPAVADAVISSAYAAISGQLTGASGGPVRIVALLLQNIGINKPPGGNGSEDFFTGGGWIMTTTPDTTNGDKATFGVGGGVKPDGTVFGHLEYVDHPPNGSPDINVHGTSVMAYFNPGVLGPSSRELQGIAQVNGVDNYYYILDVANNDPASDQLEIRLFTTSPFPCTLTTCPANGAVPFYTAGPDPLGGGNIQMHQN